MMNLSTLAELAGVSVATVSKAFSGSGEISAATKARIFAIARDQGCFDRYNKNKFEKPVIAVICPEIRSEYYAAMLTLLDREIAAKGGVMLASISNFDEARVKELFVYYTAYCHADGVILLQGCKGLQNPFAVPCVSFAKERQKNIDSIKIDLKGAIDAAVLHLKERGHREIGFIGESLTRGKLEMFRAAMRAAGMPLQQKWIKMRHERFADAGIYAVRDWLADGTLPTAIVASYDYIAIGAMQALTERGIKVPEEVSVIGMDDIAVATHLQTPLSSIRTHTEEACRRAVALVFKKIENQYYREREEIVIEAEFVGRASSGAV